MITDKPYNHAITLSLGLFKKMYGTHNFPLILILPKSIVWTKYLHSVNHDMWSFVSEQEKFGKEFKW